MSGNNSYSRRDVLRWGIGGFTAGLFGESLIGGVSADARQTAGVRSVIYIFLSGGLSQLDSFDLKPDAPADIRGEFRPAATRTPGIRIVELLPMLAARSDKWALVRSLSHPSNDHSRGHAIMLTGRTEQAPGFNPNQPQPTDWPSIAAIVNQALPRRGILPSAAVLPERLIHRTGRVIPGQFAGQMGAGRDPWFIEASPFRASTYGAYPEYAFTMQPEAAYVRDASTYGAPNLMLPAGVSAEQLSGRLRLLRRMEQVRAAGILVGSAAGTPVAHAPGSPGRPPVADAPGSPGRPPVADAPGSPELSPEARYAHSREMAVALMSDPRVRQALDVTSADIRTQERYGRNSFGWSLLMARRLVDLGVRFVQVNLGNNETWDLHGSIFPRLRDSLFPPTDRALSALIDDLEQTGQLSSTLIVMAGEFGRTPRLSTLPQHYRLPGRDHWGAVQTVFFAGGGVRGGQVIGASDRDGGQPAEQRQTPENFAATIYDTLGLPRTATWYDPLGRPHHIYQAEPIPGLR